MVLWRIVGALVEASSIIFRQDIWIGSLANAPSVNEDMRVSDGDVYFSHDLDLSSQSTPVSVRTTVTHIALFRSSSSFGC